jgi:hypothetical protein
VRSRFQAMCEAARAGISVPEIPLEGIRNAARQPAASKGRKRIVAVVLSGVLIVGAAATAEMWRGAHVSFGSSGQMQLSTVDEFRFKKDPTSDDLRNAARHATFPVEFPSGLPGGTTIAGIGYGPSIILADYNLPGSWRRSNHLLRIVLLDPRALTAPTTRHAFMFRIGGLAATGSVRWTVGHELVIVMHSLATPTEIDKIKRSMVAGAVKQ